MQESRQRQVREFLSQSHHGHRTNGLPGTDVLVNSVDPSPTSDLSAAVSSTTASPDVCMFFYVTFLFIFVSFFIKQILF